MATTARAELLRRAPLFAAMPDGVVDGLAARATRKRLRVKQRVPGDTVAVVLTGRIDVVGPDGVVVRSLVPPAIAGVSVAAGAKPSAELRVAEEAELVFVPLDAVVGALKRHPDAALAAVAHLGGVIAELSAEVAALRVHGLLERVRHRLQVLAAGRREVAITHAALAEEVGGTRANVSRALARLEREGAVRRRRGRIELGDTKATIKTACDLRL